MRISYSIAWCALLALAGCAADSTEPTPTQTPTPAPTQQAELASDRRSAGPAPTRWMSLVTMNSPDWVHAVNGLNSNEMSRLGATVYPAAAVYLQLEEGANLDEAALRAQLEKTGFTLTQLLTPADTGMERGYVLECANFR